MDDLLHHLEKRIQLFLEKYQHTLEKHQQTKEINQHLQHSKIQVTREKEQLLIKHKSAVAQIENMVKRLKSIEG